MHRMSRGLGIVILVIASCILLDFPASAATYTCDTLDNYVQGWAHIPSAHSNAFEGTSSFIRSTPAATCSTDTWSPNPSNPNSMLRNATMGWVMIADYTQANYSQVGFLAGFNQLAYVWAQFYVDYGNPNHARELVNRYLPNYVASGARHAFYEKFNANCPAPTNHPCEQSFDGSTRVTDTNFDPFVVFDPGPTFPPRWSPQYATEKTYQANDIMGTPSDRLHFTSMGAQRFEDDQFVLEPCTLNFIVSPSPPTRAAHNALSCTSVDFWTTTP